MLDGKATLNILTVRNIITNFHGFTGGLRRLIILMRVHYSLVGNRS